MIHLSRAIRYLSVLFLFLSSFSLSAQYVYFNRNDPESYIDYREFLSDEPEAIVFAVPEDIQKGIFERPVPNLKPLVEFLTSWTDEEYLQIKSLHDWITGNIQYDWEGFNGANLQRVDPYVTLNHQKAVCAGYANLFNVMARMAGFESYYVTGYAKTGGNSKYTLGDTGMARHAWNGVKIGESWYLVDTTWDSQYDRDGRWVYYNRYLFIDPEDLIVTHYPEAPAWLLLKEFLSLEEFIARGKPY